MIFNGIHRIPPEIQLKSRESIRDSMGLAPGCACIGFVGRFIQYKKPERIIEAFAVLKRRTASLVHLALIGEGPLETDLRRAVDRLGLADNVHFLGPVDGATYMPAFDVLAHADGRSLRLSLSKLCPRAFRLSRPALAELSN